MDVLVSVIVPVYGVERYLRQCLDSVVGQTYEGLDVVLVDDGSTDGCGAICDEYASRDARVRAFHTENGGLSAARNFGIGKAWGEYVFLLDGDDWLESDAVCTLVDYACNTGADVVCCGRVVEWVTESETSRSVSEVVTFDGDEALRELLYGRRVGAQAWDKLYRADLFAERVQLVLCRSYSLRILAERVLSVIMVPRQIGMECALAGWRACPTSWSNTTSGYYSHRKRHTLRSRSRLPDEVRAMARQQHVKAELLLRQHNHLG